MGKRYYYDAKGRYKGKSSSTFIADGKTYKTLVIFAIIVAIWHMIFGSNKPEVKDHSEEPKALSDTTLQSKTFRSPSKTQINVTTPVLTSDPVEPTEAAPFIRDQTAEYMKSQYVNGDSRCPRDIVEDYQKQCDAGDTQSCSLALCGREQ